MANEKDNSVLPSQWLHLLNSSHVQQKIERGPTLRAIVDSKLPDDAILEELYLAILSRFPTQEEMQVANAYGQTGSGRGRLLRDLAWALINGPEFSFRH